MKVAWTARAERNLGEIFAYIAADNPHAAVRMSILFRSAAARLADHPQMGKLGALPGTRELFPHKHYRLVYEVDEAANSIHILTLIHGARQWPQGHLD